MEIKKEHRHIAPFVDAVFPRFCLSCHGEGQIFCFACQDRWMDRPERDMCPFCGETGSNRTCLACQETNFLDGLSSYLPYGNPIMRQLIGRWKYDGDRSVEPVFQKWIAQSQNRLWPPFEDFVVASVPVHWTRKNARGFDQGEEIAKWVGAVYTMPTQTLLRRVIKTTPQAKQKHNERRVGSLDHIFEIDSKTEGLPARVVLCDDVFTSGATMDAAAKCLKNAGVEEVWGFVMAKGAQDT